MVGVDENYRKKVIWEVGNNHVVEEGVEHEELGLRGFDFYLFHEERGGYVGNDVKYFPYLLILIKLWPRHWEDQINRMNKKVDEDNGRGDPEWNELFQKLRRFSRNGFWKKNGCILSAPTFGLRGSKLW